MCVCVQAKENCWNMYQSYGEICVHCGCCSKDPVKRAEARLKICKEELEEKFNFNYWSEDPELKAIQQKNIKGWIRYFKRKIKYYEKRLKELEK